MSLNPTMVTTSENALYLFLTVFGLVRLPHAHSYYRYVSVLFFLLLCWRLCGALCNYSRIIDCFFIFFCTFVLVFYYI